MSLHISRYSASTHSLAVIFLLSCIRVCECIYIDPSCFAPAMFAACRKAPACREGRNASHWCRADMRRKDIFYSHQEDAVVMSVYMDYVQNKIKHPSCLEWNFLSGSAQKLLTDVCAWSVFYSNWPCIQNICVHVNLANVVGLSPAEKIKRNKQPLRLYSSCLSIENIYRYIDRKKHSFSSREFPNSARVFYTNHSMSTFIKFWICLLLISSWYDQT